MYNLVLPLSRNLNIDFPLVSFRKKNMTIENDKHRMLKWIACYADLITAAGLLYFNRWEGINILLFSILYLGLLRLPEYLDVGQKSGKSGVCMPVWKEFDI